MASVGGRWLSRRTDGGQSPVPEPNDCTDFGAEVAISSTAHTVFLAQIVAAPRGETTAVIR